MRFKGLDLNLIVAFEALMSDRSVSRAAERLNLSQPAMSNALARLRSYFGDELLIARNKRMYPTPFAETLLPQVRQALETMEGVIATSRHFDPATTNRTFRIMTSDYIATSILFPIVTRLSATAPGVRIELLLPSPRRIELLESGGIDLLITLREYLTPELPSEPLFEDAYHLVGRAGHPALGGETTLAAMLAYDHVHVAIGDERLPSFGDAFLDRMGIQRRIAMIAPNFGMLPWLLQDTDWLALIQGRLAAQMARNFPLVAVAPPLPIPPLVEMAQYHVTRSNDPGLRWLIDLIRDSTR
ncbi:MULTISPECIES: LysR family transcriptional regulator [unclassified Sphingomonas]|uniref:LysR family transcriptional regulator n=1 Tax=unclassified Sphingomonas TaxID=196159 RepID=UPI0021510CDE|nr:MULTISPECIES: LysR family transcriptional regulator [unclassified Sphingomonas]MCR5870755.1 LysR family transcriptional regulator [Sphingomonas sp. J344]UUY00912.1 LysR family transcriptional regulator [Sphingomonas sp. J315]